MQDLIMSFARWLENENNPVTYAVLHWNRVSDFTTYGHYFSFFIVVGLNLILDLRILGLSRRRVAASVLAEQFFPWIWGALGVAFVSGFFFLAPSAHYFFTSSYFFTKMTLVLVAALLLFLIRRRIRTWEEEPEMPLQAKLVAAVSLLLWVAAMVVGAYVPHQTEG